MRVISADMGAGDKGHRSSSTQLLRDLAIYAPARAIPAVLGLVGVMLFTRLLGPEQYGLYALVVSAVGFTATLTLNWLSRALLRHYEETRASGRLSELVSTGLVSFAGAMALALLAWSLGAFLLSHFARRDLASLALAGALALVSQGALLMVLTIARAAGRTGLYAAHSIAGAVGKIGVSVALVAVLGLGAEGVLLGTAIALGASAGAGLVRLRRVHGPSAKAFSTRLLKNLAVYGLPLTGLGIASLVLSLSDRYVIMYFLDAQEVGRYAATYDIANMSVEFSTTILMLAVVPISFRLIATRGERPTAAFLSSSVAQYLVLTVPVLALVALRAESLVRLTLGEDFASAYGVMPWVAAGAFFFGLARYLYLPFEFQKRTGRLMVIVGLAAVVNFALNLVFVPRFGIQGAAFTTLIAYVGYAVVAGVAGGRLFRWSFPWKTVVKTVGASVVSFYFGLEVLVPSDSTLLSLIGGVLVSGSIYLGILYLLNEGTVRQALKWAGARRRR